MRAERDFGGFGEGLGFGKEIETGGEESLLSFGSEVEGVGWDEFGREFIDKFFGFDFGGDVFTDGGLEFGEEKFGIGFVFVFGLISSKEIPIALELFFEKDDPRVLLYKSDIDFINDHVVLHGRK